MQMCVFSDSNKKPSVMTNLNPEAKKKACQRSWSIWLLLLKMWYVCLILQRLESEKDSLERDLSFKTDQARQYDSLLATVRENNRQLQVLHVCLSVSVCAKYSWTKFVSPNCAWRNHRFDQLVFGLFHNTTKTLEGKRAGLIPVQFLLMSVSTLAETEPELSDNHEQAWQGFGRGDLQAEPGWGRGWKWTYERLQNYFKQPKLLRFSVSEVSFSGFSLLSR